MWRMTRVANRVTLAEKAADLIKGSSILQIIHLHFYNGG